MRVAFCLLAAVSWTFGAMDSDYIHFGAFVCPREEKGLGRCLRDIINGFIPFLSTGVGNIGVPSCEPLKISSVSLQQTAGSIAVASTYTDVTVRGASSMRVQELQFRWTSDKVLGNIYIPQLRMKGKYRLSGHALAMPVHGEGMFSAIYDDIYANVTIKLGRVLRNNGDDALVCEDLDVKFDIEHASIEFENLFSEGYENNSINEDWSALARGFKGSMEQKLRDFLKPIIDYAFASLKPSDLFL